jgi:hypothetical protein
MISSKLSIHKKKSKWKLIPFARNNAGGITFRMKILGDKIQIVLPVHNPKFSIGISLAERLGFLGPTPGNRVES